jgi:hypothetical protein
MKWTEEKIAALSPNDSTERRGKALANSSKWNYLATNYEAIWGECKGSGAQPYLVQINLNGPKFKCNCPVRRPPCKHVLGIFFLFAKSSATFKYQATPDWVSNWLSKQVEVADVIEKKGASLIKTEAELEKARAAKEKRWQQRLQLMASGIAELDLWLSDIIRQGIANVDIQKPSFWNQAAAKMVDAKLPRLSVHLKETYQLILKESNWSELVVSRLGELYLWIEAFQKRETLNPLLQDELFRALGKTITKKEVLENNPKTKDIWFILGKKEGVDIEGRNYRRTWLQGQKTGEEALLMDYSFGNIGFEEEYTVGNLLEGQLAYYSHNYPQRAVFAYSETADLYEKARAKAYPSMTNFLTSYSKASAKNPWIPQFPVAIINVSVFIDENQKLQIKDVNNNIIPLGHIEEHAAWKLLAVSGGHAVSLFGEWNGLSFEPLSLLDKSKVVSL